MDLAITHTPSRFLEYGDAREYLERRTRAVDAKRRLPFSDKAIQRIDEISHGVPLHIAKLCELSLLYAKANNQHRVERVEVEKAALDLFEISPRSPITISSQPSTGVSVLRGGLRVVGVLLCTSSIIWGSMKVGAMIPSPVLHRAEAPRTLDGINHVPLASEHAIPRGSPPSARTVQPVNLKEQHPFPSETSAWRALGSMWGESALSGDICAAAQRALLQCYRTSQISLEGLRQLNRPGIVTLRGLGPSIGWGVITALSGELATLQLNDQTITVSVTSLLEVWQGDFSTLWRLPPGQPSRITDGRTGQAGAWLAQRIEELQAAGKVPVSAPQITERVKALQLASGIEVVGIAGPLTFMQVNLASGVEEPRLY